MGLGFAEAYKRLAVCGGAHGGDFSGSLKRVPRPRENVGSVLWGFVGLCDVDEEGFRREYGIGLSWRLRDCAGCIGGSAHGLQVVYDLVVFWRVKNLRPCKKIEELYTFISTSFHIFVTSSASPVKLKKDKRASLYLVARRHGRIYKPKARIRRILCKPLPHNPNNRVRLEVFWCLLRRIF